MNDLATNVILWLPAYMTEDDESVELVTKANGLILDFCDRDASLEQVLDELSTMRLSPDAFANNLDLVLRKRGI